MVRIEIRTRAQSEPLAVVEADNHAGVQVVGSWQDRISLEERQLGLPSRELVTAFERPEDWARGLTIAFRSADLWASIVYDDSPLDAGEPVELSSVVVH
jgi:hypothetical protein